MCCNLILSRSTANFSISTANFSLSSASFPLSSSMLSFVGSILNETYRSLMSRIIVDLKRCIRDKDPIEFLQDEFFLKVECYLVIFQLSSCPVSYFDLCLFYSDEIDSVDFH
jgi:hypothetical protein